MENFAWKYFYRGMFSSARNGRFTNIYGPGKTGGACMIVMFSDNWEAVTVERKP